uniref:BTB domain-containing protein n=1 Tax=Romanomermis culicivorax TaxID=13658 RepID=A0A915J9V8_ROMCU
LLNRLTTLRCNKEFCDVVLYADGKEIFCHKVVLAALSPCFYEMFNNCTSPTLQNNNSNSSNSQKHSQNGRINDVSNHDNKNGKTDNDSTTRKQNDQLQQQEDSTNLSEGCQTITSSLTDRLSYYEMNDIDYDSLEAIVNFAYSGSLQVTSDRVAQLYKTASTLRVQTCVQACALYLTKMISVKNCIGLRRCSNRTNDSLLGNQIDLFIQNNFSDIVCTSNEFTSLPCIQIDIFLAIDDKLKMKNERKLGEKIMDWLQRETSSLPEHVEFRMELLTGGPYMLYLDSDSNLQDCNDLDDNSSVGSCDLVQDYKKQNRIYPKKSRSNGLNTSNSPFLNTNGGSVGCQSINAATGNSVSTNGNMNASSVTSNAKLYRISSSESVNSFASDLEEFEWKLIAILKNSENYFVMLSIVKRKLAVISVHLNDAPFLKPGLSERLSLMLTKCGDNAESDALLAVMSDQRCNIGAVFLNNYLIVCGGNNRAECLKSVERFDLNANKWTSLAPMLKERARFGACICDGKIYAVGGSDGSSDLNTCECYDVSVNAWEKLADFPTAPRSSNMSASAGGRVYCIGGFNGQTAVRTCDCYDPIEKTWESVAPLLTGRYQAGCCSWNDKIIVVGGCDTWSCLSSAEIYDPEHNVWKSLPSMIGARRGCGAAVLNNKLYVAGGSDGSQTLCTVEVLDLNKPHCAWRPGPQLNVPRGNVRLVAADCRVYAVGGFSGKLFSNTIEYLDDGSSEWRTTVTSYSPTHSSMSPTFGGNLYDAKSIINEDPIGENS